MIQLIMDQDTGRSKGYGFITYAEAEDAKKALEQVNCWLWVRIHIADLNMNYAYEIAYQY